MINITFLSENKTDNPGCLAEHGLSIYIEAHNRRILFDAGASDVCIKNAETLGIDLEKVDSVVISHGHYDHTQGLPAFSEINKDAEIYIHKDAFGEFYGMDDGILDEDTCGIIWTAEEKELLLKRTVLTDGIYKLSEDIIISGEIPNVEGVEPPEKFYIKCFNDDNEQFLEDNMSHEQFLAIRDRDSEGKSGGIYLFSGCSHKGIVPVIRYAKELFPGEKILGLIAGMHLYCVDKDIRSKTIDEILKADVEMVMPVHCTGIKAICEIKAIMGDKCVVATAGDYFHLPMATE
ncbi:MAG: MBL fold metallo-hydrolase [Aminipila sp.]